MHNAAGSTGFYLDKTKYIVNAYGPDRPGLVSALAKALIDAKGNIETTRMARLGDECNITMLVSFTEQTKEEAEAFGKSQWSKLLIHANFDGTKYQIGDWDTFEPLI